MPSSGKIFKHTIRKHKLICTFGGKQLKKRIILFRENVFSFNLNFLFSWNIWFNPESNGKDLAPKSQIHNLLPLQNRTCNSIVDVETVAVEVGGITGYSWIGGNFRCHRFERERERERDGTIKIVKGEQVVAWWWGLTVVFHPHSNPTVTAVVEWGEWGGHR